MMRQSHSTLEQGMSPNFAASKKSRVKKKSKQLQLRDVMAVKAL